MASSSDERAASASDLLPADRPIVLFDGVCNLCNAVVQFVVERDADGTVQFAPLQSLPGQVLLERFRLETDDFDTFVLVDGTDVYTRSDAAVRLVGYLDGFWSFLGVVEHVPKPLRDAAYDLIARTRYDIFGKKDHCVRPRRDVSDVFLDGADVIPDEDGV